MTYPYLVIFALNCPDLIICVLVIPYMYSSIETAPLCKMIEQSDNYSWIYCSLGVYLVIDNYLFVPSDALPLHTILKQLEWQRTSWGYLSSCKGYCNILGIDNVMSH